MAQVCCPCNAGPSRQPELSHGGTEDAAMAGNGKQEDDDVLAIQVQLRELQKNAPSPSPTAGGAVVHQMAPMMAGVWTASC